MTGTETGRGRALGQRASFDGLVERLRTARSSAEEGDLLVDTHWNLGEDARLREDVRFRRTPWGRWILSEAFLANDTLCTHLRRERRPSLPLEEALAAMGRLVERRCVVCPADPRLVVAEGAVRLSARELTSEPVVEDGVTPLEKYVTHLPVHSLRAAAASAPAGEWGQRAQEDVIETLGWMAVRIPGHRLNPRMFAAQIEGQSMDDGRSGLVDGGYAVFELWPSGTRQGLDVLVRGAFSDPETGQYAVKRYVAEPRAADRTRLWVRLVSLNADKQRFPDIVLTPEDEDVVAVVAKVVQALSADDFVRRPRPARRPGRRDITSPEAHAEICQDLKSQVARFFEAEASRGSEEGPRKEEWRAGLVCLDAASGGLQIEVGPLRGLWGFARRLRVRGEGWDFTVLGSNARERAVRCAVPPEGGPWTWVVVGHEDDPDVSLSGLDVPGLETDRCHVFRVDAAGVGRPHSGGSLSPGQTYRILVPPSRVVGPLVALPLETCGKSWRLWELEVPRPCPAAIVEAVRQIDLDVGEPAPGANWVLVPPVDWRANARGEAYAAFAGAPGPSVEVRGLPVEIDGEASVFVEGPSSSTTIGFAPGDRHLVHLTDLEPGPYLLAILHTRTVIPPLRLPFAIVTEPPGVPGAEVSLTIGQEDLVARPGETSRATPRNLSAVGEPIGILGPPGWPVRMLWKEHSEERLLRENLGVQAGGSRIGLAAVRDRLDRRPVGDVVFDFAELGRVVLPHDRHPNPESVRTRLTELTTAWAGTVERLAGSFLQLVPQWFEPVCAALGYDVEPMPDGHEAGPPEHAVAFDLYHVERIDGDIQRQRTRLLVLIEKLATPLSPETVAWVDTLCARVGVRDALLSDGLRWAAHRRGSRLEPHIWVFPEILVDPERFAAFLHAVAEGI